MQNVQTTPNISAKHYPNAYIVAKNAIKDTHTQLVKLNELFRTS
jgi:hypothetical protein